MKVTTKGYQLGTVSDVTVLMMVVVQTNLNDAFGMKEHLIPFGIKGRVIKHIDITRSSG